MFPVAAMLLKDDGEIASGYIVEEFSKWFYEQYQNLVLKRKSLKIIINSVNKTFVQKPL